MLTVVCWKWRSLHGYRRVYTAEHVNTLARMVARNYSGEHRMVCVTDDDAGIDRNIDVIPLWGEHGGIANPTRTAGPSCYRRLRCFAPDAADLFGERFVSIDLDVVIPGSLDRLWDRPDDFVIWGDTARSTPYNGSMFLLRAGSRPRVWTEFDPERSPAATRAAGLVGSDQAWIGHCLGPDEAKWRSKDGVYSWRNELAKRGGRLPDDARVVFFHGRPDPWSPDVQREAPWIKEHYR